MIKLVAAVTCLHLQADNWSNTLTIALNAAMLASHLARCVLPTAVTDAL